MGYEGIMQFKGTWREYQARVLKNAGRYMADGRIHIVAAPGSGKTTLGIELICRMGQPALVLTPSITIREQWAARIAEAFLCDGVCAEDYISQDLKKPKAITIATYQALHSAMTRSRGEQAAEAKKFKTVGKMQADSGAEDAGEAEENTGAETGKEDFSNFDLISTMKANGTGVLCLDECHHLRSEWWKALEEFKSRCEGLKVIALTATPPYDSTPAMWKRYMEMCGEIDEEITIPELVKEGSLCPHQDFVYFNYPTKEEEAEVARFEERSNAMVQRLMQDVEFAAQICTHACLNGRATDEELLENPSALAALLIYLQAKGLPFPGRLKKLLGAGKLPQMSAAWMEKLLTGYLYEDADSYAEAKAYREKLTAELKAEGLIEKRKVCFTANDSVEKLLLSSKGKSNSIRTIVSEEYGTLGAGLRLLVLTDYIRGEYEKAVGAGDGEISALGVVPFFELLRRDAAAAGSGLRLGVLCGTVVVIPAEARTALEAAVEGEGRVNFAPFGLLPETDYLKVTAVGDAHFLTGAVTELFGQGFFQVLIGTKALLGEGWDSPCVNSLILASFVGSFMLSNQMRGRAIRVFREQPGKTSNIWHLVCLRPWREAKEDSENVSADYTLLTRRMEHFLGLNYTQDTIESGMERLTHIKPPFNKENTERMNQQTIALSRQRDLLGERWRRALSLARRMDIVEETEVADRAVTAVEFKDTFKKAILLGVGALLLFAVSALFLPKGVFGTAFRLIAMVLVALLLILAPTLYRLANPYRRLETLGGGMKKALAACGFLESAKCSVVTEENAAGYHSIGLVSDSGRDKALFAQCVKEFFAPVDNQRYLLVKQGAHKGADGFYCVPECFGRKKEDAKQFAAAVKPVIGAYEVVYTRSEKGRAVLLAGRMQALANRQDRCVSHRKVKSALE